MSRGRICSNNTSCFHTAVEAADQTCYLTQSQYTDTGPTSPDADQIAPTSKQHTRLVYLGGRICSNNTSCFHTADRLVGLVVRRPPRERKIRGSNPACAGICSGSSHTSDSKIGTPVATLSGAWRYRVNAGTGRPGVSIL